MNKLQLMKNQRSSNHELLRIFAMFYIVLYHILSYCLYLIPHEKILDNVYEAFLPTLHIGVIIFVLISGYYKIKPSVCGLLKLVAIVFVYYLPIEIVRCVCNDGRMVDVLMFITNTPYWFIRTYLYLYIIAPLLNKYIETSSSKSIFLLTLAFVVISIYFGTTQGDASLKDGKNLINFILLYLIGHIINKYQYKWQIYRSISLIVTYIILNAIIVFSLLMWDKSTIIGGYIWRLVFPYCSPILIINGIILFLIFSKIKVNSHIINVCASSMFAVYIIHCQPAFHIHAIMPICMRIINFSPICFIGALILLAICIIIFSLLLDKILTPLWWLVLKIGKLIENKVKRLVEDFF